MGRQWTHEMYVERVRELVGSEYEVLGKYVRNNVKISMLHKKCGNSFEMTPGDFKSGRRCSSCFRKLRKTTEQFKKEVAILSNNQYEVLGEYKNDRTHIQMKHLLCGYIWNATPSHFIQGKRCPKCAGNIKKTTIEFKAEVFELVGREFSVLSEYKGAKTKVRFRHNSAICNNHEFLMTPTDFLGGKRCRRCHIINYTGENHHNYKVELTEADRLRRDLYNGELRMWRDKVFKRDGYACQICKEHSHNLNAHHLNSWNTHKEQRFLVENGISLCKDCHLKFHKKYGFGNNTKEQFEEFIASL